MEVDQITELDVAESILNAVAIYKTIRSISPHRGQTRELLHIIQSTNLNWLSHSQDKGKLVTDGGHDTYYFLVSSNNVWAGGLNHDQDCKMSVLRGAQD